MHHYFNSTMKWTCKILCCNWAKEISAPTTEMHTNASDCRGFLICSSLFGQIVFITLFVFKSEIKQRYFPLIPCFSHFLILELRCSLLPFRNDIAVHVNIWQLQFTLWFKKWNFLIFVLTFFLKQLTALCNPIQ